MLPFEVAGVLLLIALIGASVLASNIKQKKE
jgi:NADH:ubiquinone oxidoreductase subunit 6 (subunit J)